MTAFEIIFLLYMIIEGWVILALLVRITDVRILLGLLRKQGDVAIVGMFGLETLNVIKELEDQLK